MTAAAVQCCAISTMGLKPTLHDVARMANVSPATVSRVAAGNCSVAAGIRERVHEAAQELGIELEERQNDKSRIIAFVLANRDLLHGFQARILLGAETYCSAQSWEMLFVSFRYSPAVRAENLHLPRILGHRSLCRAVILGGMNTPNLLEALGQLQMPFAVLGNNVGGDWRPEKCDVVYSDDVRGASEATLHLVSKGHESVCYIGNLQLPWFARCEHGYRTAMLQAGLTPRSIDIRSDGYELGYLGTKSLLANGEPVTAILAGSDQVAAGVYSALRDCSISIPHKVSVVGFNDTQGALFHPPLTTVREFPEELGRHLAEFVLKRLHDRTLASQSITIPTQLVSRDSVGALAAREAGDQHQSIETVCTP